MGETSKQSAKGTRCFRYHNYGHVAVQCPTRILAVEGVHLDDDDEVEEEIYMPVEYTSDIDKVSSIQLNIVRCLHTFPWNKDWYRSSVFYIFVVHKGKRYKLMIDG